MNVFFKIIENIEGVPVSLILFLAIVVGACYVFKLLNTPGPLVDRFFQKKQKELDNIQDEACGVLFDPIKKEIYKRQEFRRLTGINVHPDKIDRLIQLRNSSGGRYDWLQIKAAFSFIKFEPGKCSVDISLFSKIMDWTVKMLFAVPMLLFFLMALYTAFLSTGKEANQLALAIAAFASMVATIVTVLLYGYIRRDIICAKLIQDTIRVDGVTITDSFSISEETAEERNSRSS